MSTVLERYLGKTVEVVHTKHGKDVREEAF